MYTIGWIVQIAAMVLPKLAPLEVSCVISSHLNRNLHIQEFHMRLKNFDFACVHVGNVNRRMDNYQFH